MIQQYRRIRFTAARRARLEQLAAILADYDQRLTSRQVYYQFVARGLLENEERSYKLITSLITDARYAGVVDWDVIEDRGREPESPSEWSGLEELVDSALHSYRLPRWHGQETYCELWVEKQALAGVLAPIARGYHVTLMVNKGYSSASAMKESADRIIAERKHVNTVFYLGDHDPSGEDMVRDVNDRLVEFGVTGLAVVKLALTMAQIRAFNPPPNPAKVTDSRAAKYIEKYGDQSWELDALPPNELNRIVTEALDQVVDRSLMDQVIEQEDADRARLRDLVGSITRAA